MEWSQEQETAAKKKVSENSQPLPQEKQGSTVTHTETCASHKLHNRTDNLKITDDFHFIKFNFVCVCDVCYSRGI